MQRPIITIPDGFLRHLRMNWDIDWRGQGAGETTGGNTQVVFNAFPRWIGQPEVFLHGAEITQWRAIRAQAQGLLGIYRVEMIDPLGFTDPMIGSTIPFSTGQTFSTGQGFAYSPFVTAMVDVPAGASEIVVTATAAPVVGQIMSHKDWPFVITYVTPEGGSYYRLGVQMPLRAAITAGDLLDLRAFGLFEVTEGAAGNPAYGASRVSTISLSFREVLNR